jgi:insulysin
MNAVDSENAKNLQSDSWRREQLLQSLARPDHPLNSFGCGSLETLKTAPEAAGLNTRDLVMAFYKKHYSANNMRVVVYAKESLDQLQAWVEGKFSAVPNQNLPRSVFPSDPYPAATLQRILEIVPIKDTKSLRVFFPMPPVEQRYLTKPTSYLGHLLGHESAGSILSALKEKLWANGLSAGTYLSNWDFAAFAVTVELSDLGTQHVDEIVACIFAYLQMLKTQGPQQWVLRELRETGD